MRAYSLARDTRHLLESYEITGEVNWINEGLSDWAQTLVGYVDPALPITDTGFDSHIQCFFGWLSVATPVNPNPRAACGPENSLTRWLDQGDPEVLADYGAAYSMMEMLQSRSGNDFINYSPPWRRRRSRRAPGGARCTAAIPRQPQQAQQPR